MTGPVLDLAFGIVLVAILYLLVRPQSSSAALVTAFADMVSSSIRIVVSNTTQGG